MLGLHRPTDGIFVPTWFAWDHTDPFDRISPWKTFSDCSIYFLMFGIFVRFLDVSYFPGKGIGLGFSLCCPGLWPYPRGMSRRGRRIHFVVKYVFF